MFEVGSILINKKYPERIVLITQTTGEAYVLADIKNKRKGEFVVCSHPKFYIKADKETEEKYLAEKIKIFYKKTKDIKITNYL